MLRAEMARAGPSREPARQALRLAFQAAEEGRYMPVPRLHALIGFGTPARHRFWATGPGSRRRSSGRGENWTAAPGTATRREWLRFVSETEITGVEARG